MFSLTVRSSLDDISKSINLTQRLDQRTRISAQAFSDIMLAREPRYGKNSYVPESVDDAGIWDGSWVLTGVDSEWRRDYRTVAAKN